MNTITNLIVCQSDYVQPRQPTLHHQDDQSKHKHTASHQIPTISNREMQVQTLITQSRRAIVLWLGTMRGNVTGVRLRLLPVASRVSLCVSVLLQEDEFYILDSTREVLVTDGRNSECRDVYRLVV